LRIPKVVWDQWSKKINTTSVKF